MDGMKALYARTSPFWIRLALFGALLFLLFFGVASALEEAGVETSIDFGAHPRPVRRLTILFSAVAAVLLLLLPKLDDLIAYEEASRTIAHVRHGLLFRRIRAWSVAELAGLGAPYRENLFGAWRDLELLFPDGSRTYLFSVSEEEWMRDEPFRNVSEATGLPLASPP